MKSTLAWTPLAGLVVAVALVGCGDATRQPSDVGPPDGSTSAPDNCSIDVPCALEPGEPYEPGEFISPGGDVDRFQFSVDAGQIVDVEVMMSAARSRVQLRAILFAPGDQPVQVADGQWNGSPSQPQRFSFQHVAEASGTYLLDVRDVGNEDADDIRNYTVTVTLIDQTDDNEPNDLPTEATRLDRGTPATGQIASQGDVDWFIIDVPDDQILQIRPTLPSTDALEVQWEMFAAADPNEPLAQSVTIGPEQNRAVGRDGGEYLFRVFEPAGRSSTELAYQFQVDWAAEPDANDLAEPNEELQAPTVVSIGSSTEELIAATADVDYYAFDVSGASEADPVIAEVDLQWMGTPSTAVQLQFSLLGPEGELFCPGGRDGCLALRRFNDGSFTEVRCHDNRRCRHAVPLTSDGRYTVLVQDFQDNAYDETSRYRLDVSEVQLAPDDDEDFASSIREVELTTSTAAAIIEFEWAEGYISHSGDVDTFVMQFPVEPYSMNQNGDWEWSVDFLVDGPSRVEYSAVIDAPDGANSGNVGQNPIPDCGDVPPGPGNLDPCNAPPSRNAQSFQRGALSPMCAGGSDDDACCQVIFRQRSMNDGGQWVFQVRDASSLERPGGGPAGDDYDVRESAKYRFRLRARAGCRVPGPCAGRFEEPNGSDRCGRP